jgi:ornithine carbamoyltransferase
LFGVGRAPGDINKLASDENPLGTSPSALVLHCPPAYRGKEISAETFELHTDTLFDQAENRCYAQKAVLQLIAGTR